MLFHEMVKEWIDRKEINRAPSTISGYRRLLRLYILPTEIGGMEADELTEEHMIALLVPLIRRGCTRQAQLLQVLVVAVLRDAVRRRVLPFNVMDGVEKVKHQKQFTPWLTVEQARRFLDSARDREDPLYLAWVLMLCCGLRRGEILGLKWTDVDLDRKILRVERQKIRIEGTIYTTRPKSAASVREIPLDDHLAALLRLRRAGDGDILDGVNDTQLRRGLEQALTSAGVPRVTLHGLRHTMAATAAGEGVPVKVLQSLMGHAHFQTTADVYAHVDQQPRREAEILITSRLLGARLEIA